MLAPLAVRGLTSFVASTALLLTSVEVVAAPAEELPASEDQAPSEVAEPSETTPPVEAGQDTAPAETSPVDADELEQEAGTADVDEDVEDIEEAVDEDIDEDIEEAVDDDDSADFDDDFNRLRDSAEARTAQRWLAAGIAATVTGGVLVGGAIAMSQTAPCDINAGNSCFEDARDRAAVSMGVPGGLLLLGGVAMTVVGALQKRRLWYGVAVIPGGTGLSVAGRF